MRKELILLVVVALLFVIESLVFTKSSACDTQGGSNSSSNGSGGGISASSNGVSINSGVNGSVSGTTGPGGSYTDPTYGNINPNTYNLNLTSTNIGGSVFYYGTRSADGTLQAKDWTYKENGNAVTSGSYAGSTGFGTSTHPYGTWNSPYTLGIDGYNYNDAQDYTSAGNQVDMGNGKMVYTAGPHGGYLTTTHKCRECHAVHRATGEFKLTRANARFGACDWCHGTGAGSGFNIQTDNDDNYTREYNVGHTMGYGISSGKWKAPDDTYPAFTPDYWLGGFSCFDCHSPHANPARMLGFGKDGANVGLQMSGDPRYFSISNPGHDQLKDPSLTPGACGVNYKDASGKLEPIYMAGSWLLIKDPNRKIATNTETGVAFWNINLNNGAGGMDTTDIAAGQEISSLIYAKEVNGRLVGVLKQFNTTTPYPVNKIPIDWDNPIGAETTGNGNLTGYDIRNTIDKVWTVSEFCTSCHEGNAGLHTAMAPLFSEDRALRGMSEGQNGSTISDTTYWTGDYDLAYGHDAQPRHCAGRMQFNPENGIDTGPNCRNCHRGSSGCGVCHSSSGSAYTSNSVDASNKNLMLSTYNVGSTSNGMVNPLGTYSSDSSSGVVGFIKKSRITDWSSNWRQATGYVGQGQIMAAGSGTIQVTGTTCSDDGFSWPHRTLGWKMLKDDLFGLDIDGRQVSVGQTRSITVAGSTAVAQDLDSVCLDCHNPTVWNASATGYMGTEGANHVDNGDGATRYNDELLLRGLP